MDQHLRRGALKLAVVEVLDRDGRSRLVVPVWQWPVSIGRSVDCDVVLDDPHAAPLHATVTETDGALTLEVGETVNGIRLGRRQLKALERAELAAGESFDVGGTRVRIRRTSDALAHERPLAPELSGGRGRVLLLALAVTAWSLAAHWINLDPGSRITDYLPVLVGMPVLLTIWSGMWATGSRLLRHRFEFWRHARIAFGFSLIMSIAALILPVVSYASGWVVFSRVSGLVAAGLVWAMVTAHLRLVLTVRPRVLTLVMAALFVAGVSLYVTRTYQVHDRLFDELYVSTLAPPAVRLAPAVTPGRFIEEARSLQAIVDAHIGDDEERGEIPESDQTVSNRSKNER